MVALHVIPGSKKTSIAGLHDGRLKIKVASPPVDGKANAEIIEFFAEILGLPKRNVEIVKGELGRAKTVAITGVTVAALNLKIKT